MKKSVRSSKLVKTRANIRMSSHDILTYLKKRIRMEIFFVLVLYGELNVTQINNILHQNKATVARHLKDLEKAQILAVDIQNSSNRTIKPLIYRIREEHLLNLFKSDLGKIETDPIKKRDFYLTQLEKIKTTSSLVKNAFELIDPFIDRLEDAFIKEDLNTIEHIFSEFISIKKKLSLRVLLFEEEKINDFNRIYQEFRTKILELTSRPIHSESAPDENVKGILFVDATLPLLSLLDVKKKKKS